MRIHIVTAEHFSVPGLVLKAFATAEAANAEATELVNIMVNDSSMESDGDEAGDWQAWLARLQDYHGAAHCYVEITETDLIGFRDKAAAMEAAANDPDTTGEWDEIDWQEGGDGKVYSPDPANHIRARLNAAGWVMEPDGWRKVHMLKPGPNPEGWTTAEAMADEFGGR